MTSHIHNTHGIQIKDYKEANYPDIEVETNWFQCRLCPARTKFVKDCIAPHLKMSHSMDIETYERELMQPEDWPYEVVNQPVPGARDATGTLRSGARASPTQQQSTFKGSPLLPMVQAPLVQQPEQSAQGLNGKAIPEGDKWNR